MKSKSTAPLIELLESRIAPAAIITIAPTGKTATWDDVDGDKVTLKITSPKGILTDALFTKDLTSATGLLVTQLDLTDPLFKGAGVSVTVKHSALIGGDGSVNIGYIKATGQPLGVVSVAGDLGRIDAGDPVLTPKTPKAIAGLNVISMGALDGTTLPVGVTQTSELVGKVGPVKVKNSIKGILFNVTGGIAGSIDSLSIGGSLFGTADADSGRIATTGGIGPITIKGSIVGNDGENSGSIEAGGPIKSIAVGGSIYGGNSDTTTTAGTGVIRAHQTLGAVTVGGNIHGGSQQDSGLIDALGNLTSIKILGDIIGGSAGTNSGAIHVGGNALAISVKGDLLGGDALDSGVIEVDGKTGALTLLGGVKAGAGEGSGKITLGTNLADTVALLSIGRDLQGSASDDTGIITTTGNVASLIIKGSVRGNVGENSGSLHLQGGLKLGLIGADVIGSVGEGSGRIQIEAASGALTIGGSLLGGTADNTGSFFSTAKVAKLAIVGNVVGGDLDASAIQELTGSALIQAGSFGQLAIGGTLRTGRDSNAAFDHVNNAAIRATNSIGALTIRGGIEGSEDSPVIITARGQEVKPLNALQDIAFGNIVIGGTVRHANILGGYTADPDYTQAESNPDAQIIGVTVGGDWVASNLVTGVKWNDNFGDGTDTVIAGTNDSQLSARILNIKIGGQVIGTAGVTTDTFGFVAQTITVMTIGGKNAVGLNLGSGNDNDPVSLRYNLANTLDVRVFECA